MLTKDLVRYQIKGDTITPEFINPDDINLLSVAEELLELFSESQGKTRSELLEESQIVIQNSPCVPVIVRGIQKLLLDRTEFDADPNDELTQFRQELFTQTSQLLSTEPFSDFADYQQRVEKEFQLSLAEIGDKLYSDLPAYQQITAFKPLSPERLLHRYNCAQVQGLLLHCEQLELKIFNSKAESLRQLFKYLRFRQLLATIRRDKAGDYLITVDGPLNLFYQTRRYGMNLANFFSAVLYQEKWELSAQIHFRNQSYHLYLDESCEIVPDSPHFLSYIPDDIELFQKMFHRKTQEWQIAPGSDFVPLEGEFYCFPDYTLVHPSGAEISMEFFHPWHASHLILRLQHLGEQNEPLLIIGVSKVLLKDPLVAQTIEKSEYFSRFGFVFRTIPTMSKVLPILDKVLGRSTESKDDDSG